MSHALCPGILRAQPSKHHGGGLHTTRCTYTFSLKIGKLDRTSASTRVAAHNDTLTNLNSISNWIRNFTIQLRGHIREIKKKILTMKSNLWII